MPRRTRYLTRCDFRMQWTIGSNVRAPGSVGIQNHNCVVYSIGPDGQDDGGDPPPTPGSGAQTLPTEDRGFRMIR